MELVICNLTITAKEKNYILGTVDLLFDGGEYRLNYSYDKLGADIESIENLNTHAYSVGHISLFGSYDDEITSNILDYIDNNLANINLSYIKPEFRTILSL